MTLLAWLTVAGLLATFLAGLYLRGLYDDARIRSAAEQVATALADLAAVTQQCDTLTAQLATARATSQAVESELTHAASRDPALARLDFDGLRIGETRDGASAPRVVPAGGPGAKG